MEELLEDITPQDLFDFARVVPVPEEFVLTRDIIKTRKINGIRYKIGSRSRRTSTAKFRAWDTETPKGRRVVSRLATEGELPPLGVKFIIGEREQILLDAVRFSDDGALLDEVYDDAESAVLAIYSRLELAAGDMLDDGKFTLDNENGITDEVDWQVPTAHRPTSTNFWNTANATPLDDELADRNLLVSKGKGVPGVALGSHRVVQFLGSTLQYRNDYFGTQGQTNLRNLDPSEVASLRARKGLPQIREYDTFVDVDGADVRVLPDNKLFQLPSDTSRFAETQYGITAEVNTLVSGGQLTIERSEEPGIIVTKKVGDDPVNVTTRSNATAMPVMYDSEGYVARRVLA